MAKIKNTAKRVLAVTVAIVMVLGACFTGMVFVSAEGTSLATGIQNVATVDTTLYAVDASNASTITAIDGGGILYTVTNGSGGYDPYVHSVNAGTMDGANVRLQFANYVSNAPEESAQKRGYRQFIISLAQGTSDSDYKLKTGVGALLFDTVNGKLELIEGKNAGITAHDAVQTIATDDALKYDNFTGKPFTVDFLTQGTELKVTVTITNADSTISVVEGIITKESIAAIDRFPHSREAYFSISALDNGETEVPMSLEYYGFTNGFVLPEKAQNLTAYIEDTSYRPSGNSSPWAQDSIVKLQKGVKHSAFQHSPFLPLCFEQNVGGYNADTTLVFENYSDPSSASTLGHGQFLLVISRKKNQVVANGVLGINVNTNTGVVEVVKSTADNYKVNVSTYAYEPVLQIFEDDAFKYENFTGKVFTYNFKRSETADSFDFTMTVGDKTFTKTIANSVFNTTTAATGATMYITACGTGSALTKCFVTFYGYKVATPDYAANVSHLATPSMNAMSASASQISSLPYGGVRTIAQGYYPYNLNVDLGSMTTKGFTLQFANYEDFSAASFGGHYQFALSLYNCAGTNGNYHKPWKAGTVSINIDGVDGQVQILKCTAGNTWAEPQVLYTHEDFIYENFTCKPFSYTFKPGRTSGEVELVIQVDDAKHTMYFNFSDLNNNNAYNPTETKCYIGFANLENNDTNQFVEFIGYSLGFLPDYAKNLDGYASMATRDTRTMTNHNSYVTWGVVDDIDAGGVYIKQNQHSGYIPYVYNPTFNLAQQGVKLVFDNYSDPSAIGTRSHGHFMLTLVGKDSHVNSNYYKLYNGVVALDIDTNTGKVSLVKGKSTDINNNEYDVCQVIFEDDAFTYSNFSGKAFTVSLYDEGLEGVIGIEITVEDESFKGFISTKYFEANTSGSAWPTLYAMRFAISSGAYDNSSSTASQCFVNFYGYKNVDVEKEYSAPAVDKNEGVKYAEQSAIYAKGTLGFEGAISGVPATINGSAAVEYGMVLFTKTLLDGKALVIGFTNGGYSSITASATIAEGDTVPESFVVILKDKNSPADRVSDGYFRTTYVARPYVKYADGTVIYGSTVDAKLKDKAPALFE